MKLENSPQDELQDLTNRVLRLEREFPRLSRAAQDGGSSKNTAEAASAKTQRPLNGEAQKPEAEPPSLPDFVELIDARLERLERLLASMANESRVRQRRSLRQRFHCRLGELEQYEPRELRYEARYYAERLPKDPPRFAVVTPTLNQGRYLLATARSVLDQNYPNLTYVIQDGGSTDTTMEVVARHNLGPMFRSERDRGQPDAINRGFSGMDADIMAYLNSDDLLAPGALAYVARYFAAHPNVDLVYGHRIVIDQHGFEIGRWVLPPHDNEMLKWVDYVPQETLFWRRRVWETLKGIDENFQFALDWDFILRAQAAGFRIKRLPRFLGCFRVHDLQKTATLAEVCRRESDILRGRYLGEERLRRPIHRAIKGYLRRHILLHRLYKLKIVRY